jgi:hypothetical protein
MTSPHPLSESERGFKEKYVPPFSDSEKGPGDEVKRL